MATTQGSSTNQGGVTLNFTVEGDVQLSRRLRIVSDKVKDFSNEFKKTGDFLTSYSNQDVFSSKGAVLGGTWPPRKNEENYTWPILEKTGKMRAGFKSEPSAMQVIVYNVMDYFKYHQSKLPRTRLPRRIMFKLNDYLKTRIVKIFHDAIYQASQQ
jgi:hypothetical protein